MYFKKKINVALPLILWGDNFFDLFKNNYIDQMGQDPMMMPVLISAIAHDWVFVKHGF